jgi:peptidoglycan/xylan/chitin deacetylase (PgdA/CDA1 family)
VASVAGILAGCAGRVSHLATKTSAPQLPLQGSSAVEPIPTGSTVTPIPTVSTATSAAATPAFVAGPPALEVGNGNRSRPEVALTFHGAGDPALAAQVLSILNAAAAHSTIFVVGSWLNQNRPLARSILAAGHELGNHTWSHPTLIDLSTAPATVEITRCRDLLIELTGSPGAHFRQSGSQHSSALIRQLAGSAGYPVCLSYDIDSLDWTDPGAAAIRATLLTAKAGSIVSMHLGHPGTVTALPGVLADLARRGLTPVTATRLLT